ncbi:UDP-glucose 4-epimerase GalE [Candidatus Xianfuyuplasma coldseepsis]|uniref:UDP-glucose 4-epimerase n=1 Tax=Candidatus Xianfuyuplasma coldseepsis TaxID=2782163 RepID=A0A7L7KPD2_9MOLU|nr:UDP-glucose 4-epimerase GalE [Xianfuyuplasma coldseepsis]QMS84517.1 UDP-glucose 4-epimerase GalE [Xianfuyuplasma coldseepsis]
MKVLVTGGAGYIGSHTVFHLLEQRYDVIVADNYSNSSPQVIDNLKYISKKEITVFEVDLKDYTQSRSIFENNKIDAIIHFAGYKAVGESVRVPVDYYDNNINTTLNLLKLMKEFDVKKFVFSSSATVYGDPISCPIDESFPINATNPYGRTKLFIEEILKDYSIANKDTSISILRYFNPVGAHKSGLIGENPNGIPNNLVPYINQVASGKLDELPVYGNDYPTKDGTGIRDYIHVEDLAYGHIKALEYIAIKNGYFIHNLGTGVGYSVMDMINTFEEISGKKVKYRITNRRPGDIAECYANPIKAEKELNWKAKRGLKEMLEDAWRFEININR